MHVYQLCYTTASSIYYSLKNNFTVVKKIVFDTHTEQLNGTNGFVVFCYTIKYD